MSKRDILIGGAWPYANYYLHVGHLAALLPGDVIGKYYRGCGDNVMYVSGSDCHGTPITERARKEGTTPEEIATHYHEEFLKSFGNMDFEYDLYTKTMSDYHKKYVQEQLKRIYDNGYIYEKEIPQDFCEKCNKFLSDREIVGKCPKCGGESTGDQCDSCGASLDNSEVLDKNKHLYFSLSSFEKEIQELIDKNKDRWRKNAVGEAQKFLNMGLVDRAATRQLDWGVPVPIEGYEDKRVYVWFEAVMGYLSTAKQVAEQRGIDFDKFMSDSNPNLRTYYVHGKDNIPFHTIIYPALILAMKNNYRLPDYIVSSAFVNLNNDKMSKSKGNLITVNELLDIFESDTIRFYFSLKGPEVNDMNCSIEDIIQTHNKFLVGMLGNFINRNLAFINKKFDGVIKESTVDEEIKNSTVDYLKQIGECFEKGEIKNATNHIMDYISLANKYYDSKEPWNLVKDNIDEFNKVTYTCLYMIANISNMVEPIIPNASRRIKKMLNLPDYKWEEEVISGDYKVNDLQVIYNRIDEK